jgi:lipopolysaccharide assembly outer membrane protein LptD (OstA)
MDTDDLSRETHNAIIDTAERFHNDLTLQFGVLASSCDTDNEFLDESESMIKQWLTDWDLEEVIDDIFFDDLPTKKGFEKILLKIVKNIENVRKIPMEQRKFDLW